MTDGDTSLKPDPERDLSGYNVYRRLESDRRYTKLASTSKTSYTDTDVTADTTYFYVVTAVNTSGTESGYSTEASATPTGSTGSITFISPTDGASLTTSETTITGMVTTSQEIGLVVEVTGQSGMKTYIAEVNNGYFAVTVSLEEGANTIKAIATSNDGQTASQSITVTMNLNFTLATIGEYGNVTVMEFDGNYDAMNPDKSLNTKPRQAVAKEYINTHNDNYDLLVVFTNFDYAMPESENSGFYIGIKNETVGIGKEIMDNTASYGSKGKLQGMIDMGNIINGTSTSQNFEELLTLLSHELAHRWTGAVRFKDQDNSTSSALIGRDGTHWSYLLDTDGSVMYGNDWKDNSDGTFTSTGAQKKYSPLDLYLMGMIDKTEVPPMLLIENRTIDPTTLPTPGTTITGTSRTITIDDITAIEGERIPASSSAQKSFRIGYILLTRPGTFTGSEPASVSEIRDGFAGKFKTLTGEKGEILDIAPGIGIKITSPSDGATISGNTTTVTGTITNTTGSETGVTVNGIPATVSGNTFIANDVRLTEGQNDITVIATDIHGTTKTVTITITAATAANYIKITASVESGIVPLEVGVKIDGSFSINRSTLSIYGPGPNPGEFLPTDPDDGYDYKIRLSAEGIYTFTASVTDADGKIYEDTIYITALNKAEVDSLLKSKWEGMKEALKSGDITTALDYFVDGQNSKYKDVFEALKDQLSAIFSQTEDFVFVSASDSQAEYENIVVEDGTAYSYPVIFIKDESGLWKIRQF